MKGTVRRESPRAAWREGRAGDSSGGQGAVLLSLSLSLTLLLLFLLPIAPESCLPCSVNMNGGCWLTPCDTYIQL